MIDDRPAVEVAKSTFHLINVTLSYLYVYRYNLYPTFVRAHAHNRSRCIGRTIPSNAALRSALVRASVTFISHLPRYPRNRRYSSTLPREFETRNKNIINPDKYILVVRTSTPLQSSGSVRQISILSQRRSPKKIRARTKEQFPQRTGAGIKEMRPCDTSSRKGERPEEKTGGEQRIAQ